MVRRKFQSPIRSRPAFICNGCLQALRFQSKPQFEPLAASSTLRRTSPSPSSRFSTQAQTRFQSSQSQKNHADKPKSQRTPSTIFSGIQPTGIPHIGNYLGAIRPWVELQHTFPAATKIFYSVVDLHSLTASISPDDRRRFRHETVAALLASGIDPKRSVLFRQSAVGGFEFQQPYSRDHTQ